MLLALLATASADTTLHLGAAEPVSLTVDGGAYGVKPKKETKVSVEAGVHRIEGPGYAADLEVPDDALVWLTWDGSQLVLTEASSKAADRANKGMKVAGAAMAAGAAAQQAQSTSDDLKAAKSDMDKAQAGELTESSHTEVSMTIGDGGISSSSSRTTAGADGVQHDEHSTTMSSAGVVQTTSGASLTGQGYTESSSSTSIGFVELSEGVAVRLVPVGAETAVADAAPQAADEVPQVEEAQDETEDLDPGYTYWYADAQSEADGLTLRSVDAHLNAEAGKLAVHIQNTSDSYLAIRPHVAQAAIGDGTVVANSGKVKPPVIADPGGKGKATLAFRNAGPQQETWTLSLDGVVESVPTQGEVLDPGAFDLVSVNSFSVDGLTCTLAGLKKKTKETSGKLNCEYSGDGYVLADAGQIAVVMGDQEWANAARSKGPQVLAPGDKLKLSFKWQVEARVEDMQFATMPFAWRQTFQKVDGTSVAFPALELALDTARTDEEN